MPPVEFADDIARVKELLRSIRRSYALHAFEATPDDYEQVCDEDIRCEFVDGELIVHSPASLEHEELTAFVVTLLRLFTAPRQLGTVYGSNAVMMLGQRRFSPDVSVLSRDGASRIRSGRVDGPMDLAVEVISGSTRSYDRAVKLPAYREGRVGEIWLIDAERRQFEVHALGGAGYESHVLATGCWPCRSFPGLMIQVDWFWTAPLPDALACLSGPA